MPSNRNKKNHSKRYAQLIETQTPEPQELLAANNSTDKDSKVIKISDTRLSEKDDEFSRESIGKKDCDTSNASGEQQTKQQSPSQQATTEMATQSSSTCLSLAGSGNEETSIMMPEVGQESNNNKSKSKHRDARTVSQSGSQASTSFVSTAGKSRRSVSSLADGSVSVCSNTDDRHVLANDSTSNSIDLNRQDQSRIEGRLKKTISSSMLELDKSRRMDKFEVSWSNLSFSYSPSWYHSRKPTKVLRQISGKIKSNQLVALIGPSGCGKTTLLQFLAGNNPSNRDQMKILGLDEPKVAFIGQDDGLLPGLTARETLIYASKLQNNNPNFNHEEHILPILNELGLKECANRSVTKLSGGQIKRVTIAQELLYPTNLLILDEVTSGLDASTSYSIIKLLKHLVSDSEYPMSIVISIHQPSAKLFSVFDQVYLMANGSCLYDGSSNVDHINSYLGMFNLECPKFNNIADYLIEVATNEDLNCNESARDQMIHYQLKRSEQLAQSEGLDGGSYLTRSDENEKKQMEQNGQKMGRFMGSDLEDEHQQQVSMLQWKYSLYDAISRARSARPRPFHKHFYIHLSRSFLRIRRSYILTYLQLLTYILLGLQMSTFYGTSIGIMSGCPKLPSSLLSLVLSQEGDDSEISNEMRRLQENMNFLLVAVMTATFAALEITVITFPMEAKTVKREWRNGWYRVSSYFMGRTIADLPFQLIFVIVFCLICYTMTGQIGLNTWRFASFVGIMVMIALVAQSVGFTFGAIFMDNLPAAVFSAPIFVFPALLFSGFFSRVSKIPIYYMPMTYLSHFRYAFDALLVTLYGYDRCQCDQETLTSYHANLENQTSTVKDMFKYLFGSSECAPVNNGENSIEDVLTTASSDIRATTMLANATATTMSPLVVPSSTHVPKFKSIDDALADAVFDQINESNKTSTTTVLEEHSSDSGGGGGAMDHLAHKFSYRITSMLNKQGNYGHEVPEQCHDFNSYLMTEFDLRNEDLFYGLFALFIIVIFTRLICNIILNFTIASRSRT